MSEGPFGRRGEGSDPAGPGPDLPARAPTPAPAPPHPPRGISNASWIAGVAIVLILGYITLNTIRTDAPGSRGPEVGEPLPPFAAPLATSDLDGDANVAVATSPKVRHKACDVRGPKVVNVCELAERGPVVLVFTVTKSDRCEDQVDVVDRVRARFPQVQFAAVAIRGNREDVRKLVRQRGWELPVAYDRDGAVANIYAVAICPTITFADAAGQVTGTALGFTSEAEVLRQVRRLAQ